MSFVIYESNSSGRSQIYRASLNGANVIQLSSLSFDDSFPVVSADGSKIAFLSNRSGALRVWVMNSDGSGALMVSTRANVMNPTISPDGSRVAFTALVSGATQIFVVNSNGSGETNLTNNFFVDDDFACFSPNGASIGFVRDFNKLYTMTVSGASVTLRYTHLSDIQSPSFSVDGMQFVFMGDNNLQWDIYRVGLTGSGLTNLTNSSGDEFKVSGYIGP